MTPAKRTKKLMISTTLVSAALGVTAAPAAQASVTPSSCIKPPPFNDPTFQVTPAECIAPPPFADSKFFEGRWPGLPEPSLCIKPPPGIEP